jgi:hypothetical protein
MAVIQSIPGLEATIEVGGATVNEYDDPNDEAKEMKADDFDLPAAYTQDMDLPCVVRYIEAVPGQLFQVRLVKETHFQKRSNHIGYLLRVDNESLPGKQEQCASERWNSIINSCWSGNPTIGYKTHKFRFAALSIGMV